MAKYKAEKMTPGESMLVRFKYTPDNLREISRVDGGTWVPASKGGPAFKFYLDLTNCQRLRRALGEHIVFSEEILEWGRQKVAENNRLIAMASAADVEEGELQIIQEKMPEMWKMLRPYQKAGIKFIAHARNPLVADDQGLGKTWEVIGGIFESQQDTGPNLIVCPKISIENVWLYELSRFQEHPVFVAPEGRKQREQLLEEVEFCIETDTPFWLVVNPAMLTYRRGNEGDGYYDPVSKQWFDCQFPFITRTRWNTLVMDEAHLAGIANPGTQTARAVAGLSVGKRIATTGTPAGGKARRLWGILHWLEPKEFKSRTRWSDQWLIKKETMDASGNMHFDYVGINAEHEHEFYRAHAKYILRRKKEEVYKEMPPKQYVDLTVKMTDKQKKQYDLMKNEAELALGAAEEAGRLQTSLLATYSWLKQFANAYCELEEKGQRYDEELDEWIPKYKAIPTEECPKLEALMQILGELDVPDGEEQVVVFTQFRGMADMVTNYLESKGIPVDKITGAVSKREKRKDIIDTFQQGSGAKVVVMTTKAGGVSINLDRANTVVFLDETWDPDDRVQAEDRCHRASRIHQVTVYTIRTKGTIESAIKNTLRDKRQINEVLLDFYREKVDD
jgi:SNF2 family DNA or RNA helicase